MSEIRNTDRAAWRSLEHLARDPRVRELAEREFPDGATEPPTAVDRRTMLQLIAASLSMAGLAACRRPVEKIVPFVQAPEQMLPGVPAHYATTMPMGLSGIGLVVENHEGHPSKIEGNELHPASRGGAGALAQASILGLFDPDRSTTVLHDGAPSDWAAFVQAWGGIAEDHAADGGAGLAILSESFSSPTLARLRSRIAERYPGSRWATYEALSEENVLSGIASATGEARRPVHHFERAKVILALDDDFLLTDVDSVRHAREFADGRRIRGEHAEMNRLWVVEPLTTVTGSNADHRLRMPSRRIAGFLGALATTLRDRGLALGASGPGAIDGVEPRWLSALASDLLEHRGAGLIVAGPRQPVEVHAAVCALNAALGNVGSTVEYESLEDAAVPDRAELAALVSEINAGNIRTLVLLGGNPVLDAPADLGFAEALAAVERVIRLAPGVDETSALAGWHVPRAHYLEAWGDVRAAGGTLSVIQPMVLPLFGAQSDVEFLTLIADGEDRPGYDVVRETWSALLGAADFEPSWNRLLHDGLWRESAGRPVSGPEVRPDALGALDSVSDAGSGLEIVFCASPALHDGRFANNAWLQEMPDAVTKLTWDNAALVSTVTAGELGARNGDLVRVARAGAELELPLWIVPGQADGTIAVALGYGRTAAGRVGNGVGVDAYPLRTSDAVGFAADVSVVLGAGRRELAQTQDHGSMREPDFDNLLLKREGRDRPIARHGTLGEYRAHPEFAQEMAEAPEGEPLWHEKSYDDGYQWGMAIDLNACTGCNACLVACQSENNIPTVGREQVRNGREMHWLRMDRYFEGSVEDPQTYFMPVPCMHCENAPCEQVCPVSATVHDDEGLNVMVYNRCIGTRYCSNNCPYKVRRFNYFNFTKDTPEIVQLAANPNVTVRSRGVMEKCTYCTQRINAARAQAKLEEREIADGDVRTACQQACPAAAIEFGNLREATSRVSKMKAEPRNYTLFDEIHTLPRTSFLARLRNPHPDLVEG